MNPFRWVRLESYDDGVRALVLDKPPVNALGREMVEDLSRACAALGVDAEARCVVVRAAGRHFCAGADLKERRGMNLDEVRAFVPRLAAACHELATIPVPTIAAVHGTAAGGGCELALACDLRVLAQDASMGLPEVTLAIIPGAGGTQRLPRLIGPARAKRWIFTGRMHRAEACLADGVADLVVPLEGLEAAAFDLARAIAANGPVAVRLAKQAVDRGGGAPLREALEIEWGCYQGVLGTRDRDEALQAFAESRPPRFEGR